MGRFLMLFFVQSGTIENQFMEKTTVPISAIVAITVPKSGLPLIPIELNHSFRILTDV